MLSANDVLGVGVIWVMDVIQGSERENFLARPCDIRLRIYYIHTRALSDF